MEGILVGIGVGVFTLCLTAYYVLKAEHRIEKQLGEIACKLPGKKFDGFAKHQADTGKDNAD